ncbi:CHAP domain-containing protein [Phycicoccus sonneratiae]|uniref:CHAP domain-containing protein n=1 Tax=Phycicoccus sonneratiae TaxID=2807628 RepID=A0ABS2CLA5_9MICO|nr:CHAP domain-containing protein [Phycicoccus sonneraticus]MBM6400669.1 CHAP domain-containing protein [Phycicoccus sonneraticus]
MDTTPEARLGRRSALGLGLGAVAAGGLTVVTAESASAVGAADPVDDYPYKNSTIDVPGRWNFFTRECTSFVAWRLNRRNGIAFNNNWRGVHWGDASNWIHAAGLARLTVNRTPRVGAVGVPDGHGHVAWVNRIRSNGDVSYEEYNWSPPHVYNHRILPRGGWRYIHFPG